MEPLFQDFLDNFKELHQDIQVTLEQLDPDALDWSPASEINSISVLVVHLTGAERYWLGDVIASDPSGRDRDAEFKIQGWTREKVIQRLNDSDKYIQRVLETLTMNEISNPRVSPRNGRVVTVGYVLGYVLKHTALHLGHIQMTRQLWEQQRTKK